MDEGEKGVDVGGCGMSPINSSMEYSWNQSSWVCLRVWISDSWSVMFMASILEVL